MSASIRSQLTSYFQISWKKGLHGAELAPNPCLELGKGVCNLSNFSKTWETQRSKTEFHEFHGLILPQFCFLNSNIVIIPTIFTGKRVKFLEISLETMIWEN